MASSKLRILLDLFEGSSGAVSIRDIARELDVSQDRVGSMMQYWIRKGKIRVSGVGTDCGSCGAGGDCPFILDMPRTYELVKEAQGEAIKIIQPVCK
jgi:hypothetical protein